MPTSTHQLSTDKAGGSSEGTIVSTESPAGRRATLQNHEGGIPAPSVDSETPEGNAGDRPDAGEAKVP